MTRVATAGWGFWGIERDKNEFLCRTSLTSCGRLVFSFQGEWGANVKHLLLYDLWKFQINNILEATFCKTEKTIQLFIFYTVIISLWQALKTLKS